MIDLGFFNKYPYTDFHELNLDWVLKTVKDLFAAVQQIDGWIDQHQAEYEELKALYDDIIAGNFPDSIKQAFADWMNANALDLVGELVKLVIFNITDDGYFVAYIPESWDDIMFGTTGLDTGIPGYDYGHLVLSYET